MSNAGLSLSPATDAQKTQLEAWLPDGANSYNPNHTFNSAFWRSKQHIFLFTGKDYDVADAVYRGYVKVPLPWNESGRQVNLPMNFCDDITPENGWELVMNRCGFTAVLAGAFHPLLRRLMPCASRDSEIMAAVSANLSANMLGLGNAATPLGIRASRLMARGGEGVASDELCLFIVLNTASIQLLPTTVAAVWGRSAGWEERSIRAALSMASSSV